MGHLRECLLNSMELSVLYVERACLEERSVDANIRHFQRGVRNDLEIISSFSS